MAGRNKGEKVKSRAGAKALACCSSSGARPLTVCPRPSEAVYQVGAYTYPLRVGLTQEVGLCLLSRYSGTKSMLSMIGSVSWTSYCSTIQQAERTTWRGPDSLVESARDTVDPTWRLSGVEEIVLLEVFVASLRRAKLALTTGEKRVTSSHCLL